MRWTRMIKSSELKEHSKMMTMMQNLAVAIPEVPPKEAEEEERSAKGLMERQKAKNLAGPEKEQEATEGKTKEKPGSAKEAGETTKKPDKEPREDDDNKGKGNGKKKREKGPKARLESHHRSESNILIQLRCPTNLRLGQLTGQFSRISFITCIIKANCQLTTLQDPDETPPPNKRGREDW